MLIFMENSTRDKLLAVYNDFTAREYWDEPLTELPEVLGIAYTDLDSGEAQVNYNIPEQRFEYYLNGELVKVEHYEVEKAIAALEISDFDSFIGEFYY